MTTTFPAWMFTCNYLPCWNEEWVTSLVPAHSLVNDWVVCLLKCLSKACQNVMMGNLGMQHFDQLYIISKISKEKKAWNIFHNSMLVLHYKISVCMYAFKDLR